MFLRKLFSFATVTLLVALSLSAIAAYYSIQGLVAIFAAAVVPIIIMGSALEIAKVVTTIWLHRYWHRSSIILKLYLIPAVIALAFLTSMGIFGYLSRAHSDQTLISGDVISKLDIYDQKIKTARENIEANRKALQQMDMQVDQLLGRTTDDKGVNRAVQVRKQQRIERTRLQDEITQEQESISKLQDESAPIRAQLRKVEAEVGPIKYIAALIYGDNPDTNLLERAVRYVIILIVFVFDPLALVLVLAAQSSYRWLDEDLRNKRKKEDIDSESIDDSSLSTTYDIEEKKDKNIVESSIDSVNIIEDNIDKEIYDVEKTLQSDITESDGILGPHKHDVPDTIDNERMELLDDGAEVTQRKPEIRSRQNESTIKTEGVTYHQKDSGYIQFGSKSVSKEALREMHPELFASTNSSSNTNNKFGTEFPKFAKKGDTFVRVDVLPNKVFKFDGERWIEVNKDNSQTYLYEEQYIQYLVNKIDSGEYDIDLLTDEEKEQIEEFLNKQK